MLSLLLQVVPENVKNEVVTTRKMTVAQVLFILYVKFQPGGQSERMSLIRNLTELKLTNNMLEVAPRHPHMEEVVEPFGRTGSDASRPCGIGRGVGEGFRSHGEVWGANGIPIGNQSAAVVGGTLVQLLRMSRSSRSTYRPRLRNCRWALEMVEGRGLSLKAVAVQPTSGTSTTTSTGTTGGELREGGAGDKDTCRFWMTEKGCRRGDRCKFKHCRLSPKENRCFNCSGLNHSKTSCPFLKKEGKGEENVKVAKVKGGSAGGSPEKTDAGGAEGRGSQCFIFIRDKNIDGGSAYWGKRKAWWWCSPWRRDYDFCGRLGGGGLGFVEVTPKGTTHGGSM